MREQFYDLTGEDIDAYLADKRGQPAPTATAPDPADQLARQMVDESVGLAGCGGLCPEDALFAAGLGARAMVYVLSWLKTAGPLIQDPRRVAEAALAIALQNVQTLRREG